MNQLTFDLLRFHPLKSVKEWLTRYRGSIRCVVEVDAMKHGGKVSLVHAQPGEHSLWLPWYKKGTWRTGIPKQAKWTGKNLILTRIPAVALKTKNHFLLVDGCHRITELNPAFVLLDVYHPTVETRRAFTDLFNWNWK